MEMLHPSDGSLIGLYFVSSQAKRSVVCEGKIKIYCLFSSPPVQGTKFQSFKRRTQNRTAEGFVLKGATNLWIWENETGQTASKF
jgi:hypothetical protein